MTQQLSKDTIAALVSQAEIGDIAIKVDADNGYLARTGDTAVIGMMVSAMLVLQRRYEAHLEALRLQQADSAAVAVDAPIEPGWWAWNNGYERGVSAVYWGFHDELIIDEEPGGLTVDYFPGRKWYKLHMPWEKK